MWINDLLKVNTKDLTALLKYKYLFKVDKYTLEVPGKYLLEVDKYTLEQRILCCSWFYHVKFEHVNVYRDII